MLSFLNGTFGLGMFYVANCSFLTEEWQEAMKLDGLRSSHPIQVPLKSALDVNQIFDNISYSKGASVIRMLSSYLGQDMLLSGISRYLKKFTYGNATTEDLWQALSEESGQDVGEFMRLWTKSVGYPVLVLEESVVKNTIAVKQRRFLTNGEPTDEEDKTVWWVPLSIATESGISKNVVLHSRSVCGFG